MAGDIPGRGCNGSAHGGSLCHFKCVEINRCAHRKPRKGLALELGQDHREGDPGSGGKQGRITVSCRAEPGFVPKERNMGGLIAAPQAFKRLVSRLVQKLVRRVQTAELFSRHGGKIRHQIQKADRVGLRTGRCQGLDPGCVRAGNACQIGEEHDIIKLGLQGARRTVQQAGQIIGLKIMIDLKQMKLQRQAGFQLAQKQFQAVPVLQKRRAACRYQKTGPTGPPAGMQPETRR